MIRMKTLSLVMLVVAAHCNSTCYAQRTSLYANPLATQQPTFDTGTNQPATPGSVPTQGIFPLGPNQVVAGNPNIPSTSSALAGSDLAAASWTYAPVAPPRLLRIHDLVTVRVDQNAQTQQTGTMQARKNASLDMLLSDWVRLDGIDTLKPSPQSDGNQRIAGQNNEVYRADSNLRTRESMTFNITTEITDIRPNGQLVLTGHDQIDYNDNVWEVSFSGVCRPQDVGPDNVVLSRDVFDKRIAKNEAGHVRESYARGWASRLFGRFKPF